MSEYYVAAIDQGTSSTRCIVFDRSGVMVSVTQERHRQYFPQPGWVEHDAAEIWQLVRRLVPAALADAQVDSRRLVGIGITNQRETVVVWDSLTGKPLHRAIVWQDTRTSGMVDELSAGARQAAIAYRSGAPLTNYFSALRLRWLLQNVPAVGDCAARGRLMIGTIDSWLVWNLTGGVDGGVHVTDITNASRTMLMNIESGQWDPVLLDFFGVPEAALPEIRPSIGAIAATVDPIAGVPITAMIGDQQAALVGQAAFDAGDAKCTLGTGSFLLFNTGETLVRSSQGLITTVAYAAEGEAPRYALEGSNPTAGALIDWIKTNFGVIDTPAEIETLAATVDDNGGCYVVPAFSGLHAPHWSPRSEGMIVGLTSYVTRAHIARAALEANAFQVNALVQAMTADLDGSEMSLDQLLVDGGMTANNMLMQMLADLTGLTITRPAMAESVSLGAAYCAGLAGGLWVDRKQLRHNWRRAAAWSPLMTADRRRHEVARWAQAVDLADQWGRSGGPVTPTGPGDR